MEDEEDFLVGVEEKQIPNQQTGISTRKRKRNQVKSKLRTEAEKNDKKVEVKYPFLAANKLQSSKVSGNHVFTLRKCRRL